MNIETLKPFCCKDGSSPTIQNPWSDGEFTYATDSRVLLRVPRLPDVSENSEAPKCEKHVMPQWHDGPWSDVGDVPEKPEDQKCKACDGRGEHQCRDCEGFHYCHKCEGRGMVEKIQFVPVGVRQMNGDYLRLIKTLPGIQIAKEHGTPKDPLSLKFEGGIGLAMPCTPH